MSKAWVRENGLLIVAVVFLGLGACSFIFIRKEPPPEAPKFAFGTDEYFIERIAHMTDLTYLNEPADLAAVLELADTLNDLSIDRIGWIYRQTIETYGTDEHLGERFVILNQILFDLPPSQAWVLKFEGSRIVGSRISPDHPFDIGEPIGGGQPRVEAAHYFKKYGFRDLAASRANIDPKTASGP